MKILLIEDDEKIAAFLSDRFSEVDFSVDMARDGIAGLEMALSGSYDVMVIDIMLPLLDGLTIIKKIRGKGIRTPILVLSAKHSVEDIIKGLETGSDDYLIKPFSFKEASSSFFSLVSFLLIQTKGLSLEILLKISE